MLSGLLLSGLFSKEITNWRECWGLDALYYLGVATTITGEILVFVGIGIANGG